MRDTYAYVFYVSSQEVCCLAAGRASHARQREVPWSAWLDIGEWGSQLILIKKTNIDNLQAVLTRWNWLR